MWWQRPVIPALQSLRQKDSANVNPVQSTYQAQASRDLVRERVEQRNRRRTNSGDVREAVQAGKVHKCRDPGSRRTRTLKGKSLKAERKASPRP